MPIRFADIFGQDAAIGQLRRALAADRLPHAMVFAGPVGVGKHATATALAAVFLCERPTKDQEPCGQCESCRGIAAGTHPDYHFVHRFLIRTIKDTSMARDLAIDVVRIYLNAPAGLKPVLGRGKVFVIDEAERMSPGAQNSLLKTLEEPPGRTLIILLTDQPEHLLPTIRSRSQLVRFSPLPEDRVMRELASRGIAERDAADAARLSEGSLGVALRWLEDGVVAAGRELIARIDRLPADGETLSDWFRQFADAYGERQQARDPQASLDQAKREAVTTLLKIATDHFRRKLRAAPDADAAERLCAQIDAAVAAEEYVEGNVNIMLAAEHLAAEWSAAAAGTVPARA